MFLIPFYYKRKESIFDVYYIYIFLNQGKSFIQEENIDNFLNENELYYRKKTIDNEYCYVEIDSFKTDINSFYNYNENSNAECWRRFIIIKDDELHINDTNPEFILNNLKKILEIV